MFLDNLSITDKVEVLKELYKDIAGLGVEGDTQLAHINSFEADLLVKHGGSGTLHPVTGLPQYKGGGGGTPQATFQNTNQFSRIPDEVAPFAADVLTEAQDYYRMIMDRGYDPYTGAVTAPQTAEQTEAQAGLAALARGAQGTALQQEALDLQRQQAEKFTPEVAQEYMSPYQRAVTDIEKRKAVEDFERNIMPQFEAQAVKAGGMSGLGSRAGVQAALLGENLQQRLGDIEAKGLQSAFLNAQQQFQNQKAREAAQAREVAGLGPAMFSQGLAQQGALQTVGEQKQTLAQKALDEQYYKFLEQKAFPEEQLAKYSGFVYGNPLLSQRDVTSTSQGGRNFNQPSSGAQLLGTGLAAANVFRQVAPQTFGSVTSGIGSALGFAKTGGGLSDIIEKQGGGQPSVADLQRQRFNERAAGYNPLETGRARRAREAAELEQARNRLKYTPEDFEAEGGINSIGFSETITQPTLSPDELSNLKERTPTEGTGGISAEGYNRFGDKNRLSEEEVAARMRPDIYDPEFIRRQAEEREARRSEFYGRTDKERREFNRRMADRRRAEREQDYQRRRKLVGEADPIGTLLSQLSQSLLRTRDYDEIPGIGARLGEGLTQTSAKLSEADKERRKKLLDIEDEFGKRQAQESEKEFEAEGQMLSRAEERDALALAREFKLEDKILSLPFDKQKRALELINLGLKGDKLKAEIKKLQAEAAAEGTTELSPTETNALIKMFDSNNAAIFGQGFIDGQPFPEIEADLNKARQRAIEVANARGIQAANEEYMKLARRIKDAYNEGKYSQNKV